MKERNRHFDVQKIRAGCNKEVGEGKQSRGKEDASGSITGRTLHAPTRRSGRVQVYHHYGKAVPVLNRDVWTHIFWTGGQLHAPAASTPGGNIPGIHWTAGFLGAKAGQYDVEK